MHAVGESGVSPVPAFLTKLWTLVKDPSTDEFIFWDATGKSFHVYDQGRFSKEVLPKYFKHSNIASFIRQLNMYGFRKVVGVESGGLKVEKDDMVFAHQYFQRENEGLLEHIKRKVPNMKADEMKVRPDDVQRVLNDVRTMKGKQDSVNSKLEAVKRENELLWLEIANLRQKHMKQQQIVNKLIQFLMSLVGNRGVDRKRKMPLMLNDASHIEVAKVPKFSHSRSIETAGKGYQVSSPEQTHTATRGDQVGTSTLSIHEVTDPIYEIAEGEIEIAQATSDLVAAPDLDPPTHTVTPSIAPVETVTEMMPPATIVHPLNPEPAPNVEEDEEDTHSQDILRELVEQNVPPMGAFNTGMVSEEPLLTLSTDVLPLDDISFGQINTMQPAPVLCGTTACSEREGGGSGSSAPRVTDAVLGAGAVVPTSTRQLSNPKVLNRATSQHSTLEISDHLDTMQGDLDSLKDLLSGGQYTFEPSTIMGMFELGGGMTSDQQPSTSSADFISGHEVLQYNPPDDILALFDLGDLTSSTPLEEDDDDLNTPYVNMDIDGPHLLPVKPSAPISTEEVD